MDELQNVLVYIRSLWKAGDRANVLTQYKQLLNTYPDNALVFREYGRALYAEWDLSEATEIWNHAYALEPDSSVTLLYLGNLSSMGYGQDYPRALPLYQRVLEIDASDSYACFEAWTGIGMLYGAPRSGVNYQTSIDAFLEAAKLRPQCQIPHKNVAMRYFEKEPSPVLVPDYQITVRLLRARNENESAASVEQAIRQIEHQKSPQPIEDTCRSLFERWPNGPLL